MQHQQVFAENRFKTIIINNGGEKEQHSNK